MMRCWILVASLCCSLPASAKEIVVSMAGMAYSPENVSALVGDTIRFVNDDGADHNVFIPTAEFASDLGKQEPGAEVVFTVRKTGRFVVECVLHDVMQATVEVSK